MKFFKQKLFKLILALALCLILAIWNPSGIVNPIRGIFMAAAYPFQKTFYFLSFKTRNFYELVSSISDLKRDNERLIKENHALLSQVSSLREQKRENETLRSQLNLAPRNQFDLETALVIGQSPYGQSAWIVIDKGRTSQIREDMPVIVSDGILIGRVGEVYDFSAKVILLTDPTSHVNALDLETGARGILTGEYNLGLTLDMVSQTDVLNVGDDIVTSGLGGLFPKGLLIGKIQNVKNTHDKLFQQALIAANIKYSDLETVFIIKK